MNNNLLLLIGALIAAAYLAGRYSGPERVEVKKEYVDRVVIKEVESADKDQLKTVIEVVRPDGTKIAKTRTHTVRQVLKVSSIENDQTTRDQSIVTYRRGVTVSVLAGVPLTGVSLYRPVYGASVIKQLLGPFSLGVWAFTDLRIGLSIGFEL